MRSALLNISDALYIGVEYVVKSRLNYHPFVISRFFLKVFEKNLNFPANAKRGRRLKGDGHCVVPNQGTDNV